MFKVTLGTADIQCKIGDTTRLFTFQVLDRQATPILGLNDDFAAESCQAGQGCL